jgi:hypothetical protein
MDEQLHEYILSRLSGDVLEDDIILSVCEQTGMDWQSVRALVDEVKSDHEPEIELRQFPVMGLVSIVFMVLGLILLLGPVFYLWSILGISKIFLDAISGASRVNVETVLYLIRVRCALMSWFELPSILFTMMTGVAVIIVNFKYLGEYCGDLFTHKSGLDNPKINPR